jgi:putative endonuclease
MYYTYVLISKVDDNLYIGYTKDLKLRFEQHNNREVNSTKNRIHLTLIYYESCVSKVDALIREKYLKTYRGRMFLKKRLKSYFTGQKTTNKK